MPINFVVAIYKFAQPFVFIMPLAIYGRNLLAEWAVTGARRR